MRENFQKYIAVYCTQKADKEISMGLPSTMQKSKKIFHLRRNKVQHFAYFCTNFSKPCY